MQEKRRVKLTYPASLQDQPILYRLIRDFDLATNIRRASVGVTEAWLIVDIEGDTESIDAALKWAAEQGLAIEPVTGEA
jgi:ABC-type methionine transport system ATPase subunit